MDIVLNKEVTPDKPVAYVPKGINRSLHICQLDPAYQHSIRRAVIEVEVQAGYTGDDLAHMADQVMCGRIADLEENIHLVESIVPVHKTTTSFKAFLVSQNKGAGFDKDTGDSATPTIDRPEPEK